MITNYTLILLSGGVGTRMNNPVPKQYMLLAGKPVIMHTLEKADLIEEINEIIIVCSDEYISPLKLMVEQYGIKKSIKYAQAGKTRQQSVRSGLLQTENKNVILHEAARPFVKIEDFMCLINENAENAILGIDIPFTVVKGFENVEQPLLKRSELVNVQLPQKFNREILLNAHIQAENEQQDFTEDATMVCNYYPNVKIKICKGKEYNIKLTTATDMIIGEQIYENEFRRRK